MSVGGARSRGVLGFSTTSRTATKYFATVARIPQLSMRCAATAKKVDFIKKPDVNSSKTTGLCWDRCGSLRMSLGLKVKPFHYDLSDSRHDSRLPSHRKPTFIRMVPATELTRYGFCSINREPNRHWLCTRGSVSFSGANVRRRQEEPLFLDVARVDLWNGLMLVTNLA